MTETLPNLAMSNEFIPVLLAGGEGKRLRPLGDSNHPKQFLTLTNDKLSLLQHTAGQALLQSPGANIITVGSQKYKTTLTSQLQYIDPKLVTHLILEPLARNTATACILAALYAIDHADNPVLWIMPTDSLILHPTKLQQALLETRPLAEQGKIVCFGIAPDYANTQYGYIIGGENITTHSYHVSEFIEKPDLETCHQLLKHKQCYINSGMFLLSAGTILTEFKQYNSELLDLLIETYKNGKWQSGHYMLQEEDYNKLPAEPIDKALMEHTNKLAVHPVEIGWSDLGSWQGIWELSQHEGEGDPLQRFLKKLAKVKAA